MILNELAAEVTRELMARDEKLVLAESCTCGLLASTLGVIPGISNYFCGSAVVYRADSKRRWLGVSKKTIKARTTESHHVAEEMALGVLKNTPEAHWAISIVGHFGPEAPEHKDGVIFVCIARRTKKGKLKVKDRLEHKLQKNDRQKRQKEATEIVLTHLGRLLSKKSATEESNLVTA